MKIITGPRGSPLFLKITVLVVALWVPLIWSFYNMSHLVVRLMMPMHAAWGSGQAFLVWVMWATMMAAMMLPSASPMVLTYARIAKHRATKPATGCLVWGYVAVWSVFSIGATGVQWALQAAGLLTPMIVMSDTRAAAVLMILVGLSQWTPVKQLCLSNCRTPIGYFTREWRDGASGAFRMGLRHGVFCVGCCWSLMALLFVFGVMNLTAIALVTAMVIAEKTLPHGLYLARLGGVALILWGGLAFTSSI